MTPETPFFASAIVLLLIALYACVQVRWADERSNADFTRYLEAHRECQEIPCRLNVWVGYRGWNANFKRAALRQVLVIKRGSLIHVAPAGAVRLIVSRDDME